MIEILSLISRKHQWLRPFTLLVGAVCVCLFLYAIFSSSSHSQDVYLIPSLIGFFWALLFNILVSAFLNVPKKPDSKDKLFKRLSVRIKRGCYHLLGIMFIILSLAVLVLSFKMVGIWRAEY
jgi:hypothetical protein